MSQVGEAHKRMMFQMELCDHHLWTARGLASPGDCPLALTANLDNAIKALRIALQIASDIDSGTVYGDP